MLLNSEDLFSSSASSAKRKRRWAQSIGKRLALGFFALVVLMMIVLLQAVLQNYKANQTMQEFASQDVTRLNGVHLLGLQIEGLGSALSRLIHAERNFRVKEYEDVDGRNRHILQTLEMLSNSLIDPAQIAVLQRLAVANNAYKVAFQEVADQVEAGDTAAAGRALNTHVNPALRSMLSELNTLLQHEKDSMDRRLARAQASFHQALILIATLSAALMAMAIWLAWLTTRSVVQPLSALEAAADIMADGNYATVVPRTGADEVDRVGTALNRMAANVTRTNVLLQSVFDAASEVAIVATGLAGTITIFNRGAERLFGYAATEVVGVHTNDLLFDPVELERNGVAMSQATGRTVAGVDVLTDQSVLGKTTEWTVIRKDGSRIFVALVVTNLFDTEGVLAGYLAISYDISQEKAARESLNEALADAEAATAAKGQFLANMSHEIRTPMNAILGMLRLLLNTELNPRQLDYSAKAEGAAKSLLGLINDILDFSKIEAGKMTLEIIEFSIEKLLRDLSVIVSTNVGKKPVEVLFDLDPAVPTTLMGDAMRLQQVLINLSGNAVKFTERGEVVIQVKLLTQSDTSVRLRFGVRDSGIGIAPENQKHIFTGFSQAEASTTRRFGGTGLGLSISKRLVDLMGAELTLRSAVGEGSTFYFDVDMPFASTVVTLVGNDLEAEHQWQSALTELSGMPVLVIDDNVVALELAATMVTTCGWQVDSAAGGQEALALLRHRCAQNLPPYRAIFLDWEMSGLDGWETLHAIHELNENIGSPLMIMLTGHGRDQLNSRSAQEQAQLHAFLVKPVTATMIQEAVVNAHLGHSNLRTKARSNSLSSARLSGIRILVVEDNRINQQVAQELLVAQGAIVELAENGQLGVDAIVSTRPPFDVVLMDLQMPVMDGYAATKVLREQLGMHDLPIIAMTANAMASDRVQCLAAGMNAHVGKPFDLPHLISVVLQYAKPRAVVVHASEVPEPPLLPPEQMSPLPILDGFDIAGALDKMGGNTDLYGDILLSYIAEVQTNPDQLDALLSHDDFAGAARLLHTLKGLSGTVGAMALAERAKHWETLLKNTPTQQDATSVSVGLRVEIATAIRALQEVARAIGISTESTPAGNELPLLSRLEQLKDMLQQEDLAAIDFFAELQVSLLSEWAETSALVALSAAMENFDLVSAEAACIQLITECTPQEA